MPVHVWKMPVPGHCNSPEDERKAKRRKVFQWQRWVNVLDQDYDYLFALQIYVQDKLN